jgi:hypothetical protein
MQAPAAPTASDPIRVIFLAHSDCAGFAAARGACAMDGCGAFG